jgi:hypothetical protein
MAPTTCRPRCVWPKQRYPSVDIRIADLVGIDDCLLACLAAGAIFRLPMVPTEQMAVLLVTSGSKRREANADVFKAARLLSDHVDAAILEVAFLRLARPFMQDALQRCALLGARCVVVVPHFLNTGLLAKRVPGKLVWLRRQFPELELIEVSHLGLDPSLVDVAAHSQQIKAKLVVASIEATHALIFEPIGCCQTCCVRTGLERQLKEGLPASLSAAHDGTTRLFMEQDNEEAVASAAANPLVTVVTAPTADHNIQRGRFGAFMAEVESFLRDCPLISSRQEGAKIGRRRGRAGNSSVTPDNADWSGARDGGLPPHAPEPGYPVADAHRCTRHRQDPPRARPRRRRNRLD